MGDKEGSGGGGWGLALCVHEGRRGGEVSTGLRCPLRLTSGTTIARARVHQPTSWPRIACAGPQNLAPSAPLASTMMMKMWREAFLDVQWVCMACVCSGSAPLPSAAVRPSLCPSPLCRRLPPPPRHTVPSRVSRAARVPADHRRPRKGSISPSGCSRHRWEQLQQRVRSSLGVQDAHRR